ncbi:protein disulfide isomerase 1 [Volvox carteri f. nagariensis]|uniref:Protein disulfide-isomerase n=1 Tax=Volvox carteri f. nagariensis TaxID=3068 RepID=Q9SBN2_VOLCA|nr:protein disulfide isomerase 1 [Volvox carteri f. nagariensis]AAD55566.1 protein disulfide isomerase precursor [Volvox carteri f. nagariensis]EFJ41881.1 protein disulfide isomerase 1 [Volvox carteri f. nagariensis]|eukprot:XP_002957079.1 protein disulfide isomerase 1 [Volvox carteri f. nagariensis]
MPRWSLLALLFGLLLVAAPFSKHQLAWASDEYDEDDDDEAPADDDKDVVVVTTKNFDDVVKKSKFALVEFYAPWCGHCKSLKPQYAAAATTLKKVAPDAVLAKVDATVEESLAGKFGIQGYPTLKWFVDGELVSDYNGPRDAEGIVNWIKKKTGPSAVTVDDVDKLQELEADNEVLAVGYFSAFEGEAFEAFISYAKKTESVSFAQTTSAEVAKAAGLEAPGTLAVVKNFKDEPRATVVLAELDEEKIADFVKSEKLPLTIEFSKGNSDKIFNSGIPMQLILWTSAKDLESGAEVRTIYKTVASKFKGKLVFVTVNNEGEEADPVTNFFGLKGAASPVLLGFYMEKNKKYKLQEPFTLEAVEKFAESILDGTAQPEYKSQPIPEDPYEDGVHVVVGKSVDSVVLDPTKDVLLEVYAPWCGHCKKLDPIYKKLAKRFKKVSSVVIAKMDGTENEHPLVDVKGFPTLIFFPAGEDATPIPFEGGDRTLKSLTKFIKANAKVPYELPKKSSAEESAADDAPSAKDEL